MCTVLMEGGAVQLGPVTVLKFGSSLLSGGDGFKKVVGEVEREVALGHRVLAVVSAMKGTTDRLLDTARDLSAKSSSGVAVGAASDGRRRFGRSSGNRARSVGGERARSDRR